MTVIIKPIDQRALFDSSHYREFENVESIDDDTYPLIKLRHKDHNCYILMKVPDDCYLLVINNDKHT